jgi:hypothetical protein
MVQEGIPKDRPADGTQTFTLLRFLPLNSFQFGPWFPFLLSFVQPFF